MNQQFLGPLVSRLQVLPSSHFAGSRLLDQSLPQRVVAIDEEVIAGVKTLERVTVWQLVKLAFRTSIAFLAGKHQIPDAVYYLPEAMSL